MSGNGHNMKWATIGAVALVTGLAALSGVADRQPDTAVVPTGNKTKSQPLMSGAGVRPLSQPPETLVEIDPCLLYRCGEERWRAKKKLVAYSAPDTASPRVGIVESGAVFKPINMAWVTLKPRVDKVRERFASGEASGNDPVWYERGQLIYKYAYWGHGCITVWTNGYLYNYFEEGRRPRKATTCLDLLVSDHYFDNVQKGSYVIWLKLRFDDGRVGWIIRERDGKDSNLEGGAIES